MSVFDFVGAFFVNPQPESDFERLKREAREDIYAGLDFNLTDEQLEQLSGMGRMQEEPVTNHLKEKTIYHRNGGVTVFRNYAVIVSDGVTYKAPILDPEGRLVQIGP